MHNPLERTRTQMSNWILETERLRLRPYALADERALFEVFNDEDARAFYPRMVDPANVRGWIEWNLRNYEEFGLGLWALELKTTGAFLGDCGLTYQDVESAKELEIGYHVHRGERGKGYATEAASACLDFGFERTACGRICSIVNPSNLASCKVAARIHAESRQLLSNGQPTLLFFTSRAAWKGRPTSA
jgi:[ribosomal protein S5]-alanine N-acetyltransferase